MKVKHLIEKLQEADPEKIVVTAVDEEGNGFGEVWAINIENQVFLEEGRGEVHFAQLTPELEKEGYTEEDVWEGDDGIPCVVLW